MTPSAMAFLYIISGGFSANRRASSDASREAPESKRTSSSPRAPPPAAILRFPAGAAEARHMVHGSGAFPRRRPLDAREFRAPTGKQPSHNQLREHPLADAALWPASHK